VRLVVTDRLSRDRWQQISHLRDHVPTRLRQHVEAMNIVGYPAILKIVVIRRPIPFRLCSFSRYNNAVVGPVVVVAPMLYETPSNESTQRSVLGWLRTIDAAVSVEPSQHVPLFS
jgi:hypothetical protein